MCTCHKIYYIREFLTGSYNKDAKFATLTEYAFILSLYICLSGSRWRVKDLTYKISKYPTTKRLTRSDVDAEVKRALDVWAEHTDLSFTQKTSGKVHIDIRFDKGEHGDGDPFDGPGGTLAHAFFPVFGGDAHFDDDEHWTSGSFTGQLRLRSYSQLKYIAFLSAQKCSKKNLKGY